LGQAERQGSRYYNNREKKWRTDTSWAAQAFSTHESSLGGKTKSRRQKALGLRHAISERADLKVEGQPTAFARASLIEHCEWLPRKDGGRLPDLKDYVATAQPSWF
jgi:hypothetical protein